jgi:hypothetical protein
MVQQQQVEMLSAMYTHTFTTLQAKLQNMCQTPTVQDTVRISSFFTEPEFFIFDRTTEMPKWQILRLSLSLVKEYLNACHTHKCSLCP